MIGQTTWSRELVKTGFLVLVSLFVFIPVYFMLVISVKDGRQFFEHPFVPTWPLHLENYAAAWDHVGPFVGRTALVAGLGTFWSLFLGSVTAFHLARFRFVGREAAFYYVVALMMVPGILNLIPLYVLVTQMDGLARAAGQAINGLLGYDALSGPLQLRLLNTLWVLILPAAAGGQIMVVFVLRQFFEAQPQALFDAAVTDGAGNFGLYRHVALPLAKPIMGAMGVINVVVLWNDYIWPLVVVQQDHFTVAVGLRYLEGQYNVQYGPLMAGYVLAGLPLLLMFILSMRLFVAGMSSGAIKM